MNLYVFHSNVWKLALYPCVTLQFTVRKEKENIRNQPQDMHVDYLLFDLARKKEP